MSIKQLEETLGNALRKSGERDIPFGEYHSSTITGCPLKGFLDKMTDSESELNNYMFAGSAVHYYVQNHPGLLTQAMQDAGFHPLDISYEVGTHYELGDGIHLSGTCDVLAGNEDSTVILDLKYSSVRPETHQGRLFKYMSQVNTYSFMFGADEYGLLLIYSRANDRAGGNKPQNIPDSILVLPGEPNEDNWELTKAKARMIHDALIEYGYPENIRFDQPDLEEASLEFWEEVMGIIDKKACPSYDKECRYCDHKEYCPVKQGKLGGLRGLGSAD